MTAVMTTVTRTRQNRRMLRADLRERIFDAAIALFRRSGFDATTVDQIARAAGVAKGTMFNFFPTKGAVLLEYYGRLEARFREALSALEPDHPRKALADFYGKVEALLRAEGSLGDALLRQIAIDAALRKADESSGTVDRRLLAAYFEACARRGTIAVDVEPALAADVVADLWSATAQQWVAAGRSFSLRQRLAAKLALVLDGIEGRD